VVTLPTSIWYKCPIKNSIDFLEIKKAAYIRKYRTKVTNNNEGVNCSAMVVLSIVPLLKPPK